MFMTLVTDDNSSVEAKYFFRVNIRVRTFGFPHRLNLAMKSFVVNVR